jgi:hypothetical protein
MRTSAAARHGDDAAVARRMKSFVCSRSGRLTLFMAADSTIKICVYLLSTFLQMTKVITHPRTVCIVKSRRAAATMYNISFTAQFWNT